MELEYHHRCNEYGQHRQDDHQHVLGQFRLCHALGDFNSPIHEGDQNLCPDKDPFEPPEYSPVSDRDAGELDPAGTALGRAPDEHQEHKEYDGDTGKQLDLLALISRRADSRCGEKEALPHCLSEREAVKIVQIRDNHGGACRKEEEEQFDLLVTKEGEFPFPV